MPHNSDNGCKCLNLWEIPGLSGLYRDYVSHKPTAISLFEWDYSYFQSFRKLGRSLQNREYDRPRMAATLIEQNTNWGAGEKALDNCRKLEKNNCLAVVTGQQVGFCGGPLYTVLKALHACRLAAHLEVELGQPVVPIFWMELEDHDWREAATFYYKNELDGPIKRTIPIAEDGSRKPVNRIQLGDKLEPTLKLMEDEIKRTEFTEDTLELIRSSYESVNTLADGFARFMTNLLTHHGLILADPSAPFFKQQASMVFRQEIDSPLTFSDAFHTHAEEIRNADYRNQVKVRNDRLNLFLIDEDEKHRIMLSDSPGLFYLSDPSDIISREDLLAVADSEPERLVPSVLLRPLVQDTLFPTLVYVAGPSETSYFAQLRPAYRESGIPMPVILPRCGATVIGGGPLRAMKKYNIHSTDILQESESLLQHVLSEHVPSHAEQVFKWTSDEIFSAIDRLRLELDTGEGTFGKDVKATEGKIEYHLGKLQDRFLKEIERRHEVVVRQINNLTHALYPNGSLQERVYTVAEFINLYGFSLIDTLYKKIDPLQPHHALIEV
jgi:bacillithiol biosynthesis cysteine-adding enzyme BshC